ncbi:MAG: PorP/SprF family type IX secretion system membrane protein [Flavobacteriales bacterium]
MKQLTTLAILLSAFSLSAQDIHFSQYMESPMNLSPALAGTDASSARANLNYRNQWGSFDKAYSTMGASFDIGMMRDPNKSAFLGAGLSILNDKAGTGGLNRMSVAGNLSSVIEVGNKSYLSVGIQGSFNQRSISMDAFKWDAQFQNLSYNSSLASGETGGSLSKTFFDLGAGLAFVKHGNSSNLSNSDDFSMTAGLAAYHINRPNQAFQGSDKMNMRYNGFLQMSFGIGGSNMSIQPQLAYWRQGTLQEINTGMMFRYVLKPESQHTGFERGIALSIGGFYRVKDALYPMMLLEYGDFALGMSYDVNVSSLTPYSQSRGGFEISLRYRDLNGLVFGKPGQRRML